MAEIITENGRKAIKKIAQISQVARAIDLMPTGEEFVLRLIGDLTIIAKRVNSLSARMNDILDRYASIPTEFLLEGFDEVLDKLNDINDSAKFAIAETANLFSTTVSSVNDLTNAIGDATSAVTSATLQIGGGLTYGAVATYSNIELATKGVSTDQVDLIRDEVMKDVIDGKIPVSEMNAEIERRCIEAASPAAKTAEDIRDWTENAAKESTESIGDFFDNIGGGLDDANKWIEGVKDDADSVVDNTVGKAIEMVENAKKKVEELIEKARTAVEKFNKDFDDCFGFLVKAADISNHVSDTASEMNTPVFDAVAEMSDEVTKFIENFSIGKVVTGLAGMAVGAGVATLAMDLLPKIDVDRMLKDIIGGVDTYHMDRMTQLYNNKYYDNAPDGVVDLKSVPDSIWRLSEDDLNKYNEKGYKKYCEEFTELNDNKRTELYDKLKDASSRKERREIRKQIREEYREWVSNDENKSALKAMRKVRRDAIKARQIEKYKAFWRIEMDYLKQEFTNIKDIIKDDWDAMMAQYRTAYEEICNFFANDGSGGCESIDRCCDRINDDAEQIVELCGSITTELTNAVAMVPTPYAIGTCVDMPVHKILAFFKDVKIILTFLKNLIRLGIDIVSQFTILAKIVANGLQSLAEIMKMLMELIGIDKILNMIDFLVALFRPKMVDAKILLENSLSPIYYDETEEYEARVEAMEAVLENERGGYVEKFIYTDDPNARKKYTEGEYIYGGRNGTDDEVEGWLEELEKKGEREIVAYRSPILNAEGDDFAGWIYYHAYAYDNMNKKWSPSKMRRRNKVIKKASKKNKMRGGRLIGGVAQLKKHKKFGYYSNGEYIKSSVTGFDAYYWYTKWTNDPTDCEADFTNLDGKDVVSPIQTTSNGSLVELSDGRRVFVEGKIVQSGDFVNVNGVKYRVK